MIKDLILEYRKNNSKSGIQDLTKIFGLSFEEILEHLKETLPKGQLEFFKGKGVHIYDKKGRIIYHEDMRGKWIRFTFKGDDCIITKN